MPMCRRMDNLGRIVIPKEIRDRYLIDDTTFLDIFTNGDNVVLRIHQMYCPLCGNPIEHDTNIKKYHGKDICPACIEDIKSRIDEF